MQILRMVLKLEKKMTALELEAAYHALWNRKWDKELEEMSKEELQEYMEDCERKIYGLNEIGLSKIHYMEESVPHRTITIFIEEIAFLHGQAMKALRMIHGIKENEPY